jgi:crooked neck
LEKARKVMGNGMGVNPKEKTFRDYIALELGLREFDRARRVYEKYISWKRGNARAWLGYTELEVGLGEVERARGLFELAVGDCESPEVWKAYIDFEVGNSEWERARRLYERLNEITNSVKVTRINKVMISKARFEFEANGDKGIQMARKEFEKCVDWCRQNTLKEERMVVLNAWEEFENEHGDEQGLKAVQQRKPKIVKKRRRLEGDNGWEEYLDYVFEEDGEDQGNVKLLAMARQWKMKMAEASDSDDD